MIVTLSERDFTALVEEKTDEIHARRAYVPPLLAAMSSEWVAKLDAPATLLMFGIINRTFNAGRAADIIPLSEFISGSDRRGDMPYAPLPMTLNTLRKHLRALLDRDLVTAYSYHDALSGYENSARMFEINCRKLMDVPALVQGRDAFLLDVEARVAEEKGRTPHQKLL